MRPDSSKFCCRCSTWKARSEFHQGHSWCKPCRKSYAAEFKTKHPRRHFGRTLRKYGITLDEYDAMRAKQGGRCAICRMSPKGDATWRLVVDHCHATGRVRGLLCHTCNVALGLFRDDGDRLVRAIEYLNQD